MPETPPKAASRSAMQSLLSLIKRNRSAEEVPEKLAHRMQRMERDMSRRLPSKGFLKS
jgi:hypothetical protein